MRENLMLELVIVAISFSFALGQISLSASAINASFGKPQGDLSTIYWNRGRNLDIFTDGTRWPNHTTPFNGAGYGRPADAFSPQEQTRLYALVSCYDFPLDNRLVAFEVDGPTNAIQNVTIVRTAMTNASGIASIDFTAPSDPAISFGTWSASARAEIFKVKVFDTLNFRVGQIVQIDQLETVDNMMHAKKAFIKGESLNFNMTFQNIGMAPRTVTFTVLICDELGMPFGFVIVGGFTLSHGITETFRPGSLIPDWASIGVGTAYGNVYTALPTAGGVPYAPEISTTFQIARS